MTNKQGEITKEDLLLRALKAKQLIMEAIHPAKTYMPFFLQHFPELDNEQGIEDIRLHWNLRKHTENLIEKMEALPSLIKNN